MTPAHMLPSPAAFQQAARRIMHRCDELSTCTERAGEITRTVCSVAMRQAHAKLRGWMEAAGMSCRLDAATNLIGRHGTSAGRPRTLLIGSHLDSVVDAGKYDGPLGVLMGLALVELLQENHCTLPFVIDVIGFCEEEGVRFQLPYIGSRAIVGELSDDMLSLRDESGVALREVLRGFGGDPAELSTARYLPGEVIAFVEPHIEQGPVLDLEKFPVGIVTGIAGQTRASVQFSGRAGHAGATPMASRRDALAAAAEFILEVEKLGRAPSCLPRAGADGPRETLADADSTPLVATVGQLNVSPNVGNVIPGKVQLRVDVRHFNDTIRAAAFESLVQGARSIADRRKVRLVIDWVQQQAAVACNSSCIRLLEQSVAATGIRPLRLVSGAGHDTAVLAPHFPTAMLFLRSPDGLSHHPDEAVAEADVAVALEVLWRFVDALVQGNNAVSELR